MHILPPLSTVDLTMYERTHEKRKRISALRHSPFNICQPSSAERLRLSRGSVNAFVRACESGVSLPNLYCLDVCRGRGLIGDAGMTNLSRAITTGGLAKLTILNLRSNQVSDPGMSSLAEALARGGLGSLQSLALFDNKIDDAGCNALAKACGRGSLASLERLILDSNQIGGAGCTALAKACASGALAHLTEHCGSQHA